MGRVLDLDWHAAGEAVAVAYVTGKLFAIHPPLHPCDGQERARRRRLAARAQVGRQSPAGGQVWPHNAPLQPPRPCVEQAPGAPGGRAARYPCPFSGLPRTTEQDGRDYGEKVVSQLEFSVRDL